MRTLIKSAAFIAATTLTLSANAALTFNFDDGAQGWTVFDGGALVEKFTGGNGGGYLEIADTTSGDLRLVAPAAALGNLSSYLGGTLSFDAKNINNDTPDWPEFGMVEITSGGTTLTFDGIAANEPPVGAGWKTYTITLNTANFGASLPSILGAVTELKVKGEFHNGVSEVVGIDNIRLVSAVPEPTELAMLLAGLGLVGWAARRKQRQG